jgi:glutathione-specific gamma-glutamylcyclotransferase
METPLWVFGYGSLIWDPGFRPVEVRLARLQGWQRSFCMWSVHYRGTAETPGLVLALDAAEGAVCAGVAFRVAAGEEEEVLAGLRERELISYAYIERWLPVTIEGGLAVQAVTYVMNRAHAQYAGPLGVDVQASVIARASGVRGPNRDYLEATVSHLAQLGIADADLAALASRVRQISRDPAAKPL